MKMISSFIAVMTLVGIFFGGYLYIDRRYALANDMQVIKLNVQMMGDRLEQKILQDRRTDLESRKDKYLFKCGKELVQCDDFAREQYKKIERDLRSVQEKLDKMR